MSKNKGIRIKNKIEKYLADGERATNTIVEYINNNTKNGTTSAQVGSLLSFDDRFVNVGVTQTRGMEHGWYPTAVWNLKVNMNANYTA